MAKSNAERSEKAAAKRKSRGEVEVRFHTLPATRQALAELMVWSGIEEHGEAITLMIHHLHGLGPGGAARARPVRSPWPGRSATVFLMERPIRGGARATLASARSRTSSAAGTRPTRTISS